MTGRFSYNNPNLQQIPARDSADAELKIGTLIRGLFLPEKKRNGDHLITLSKSHDLWFTMLIK